jgi:hypothetical protein
MSAAVEGLKMRHLLIVSVLVTAVVIGGCGGGGGAKVVPDQQMGTLAGRLVGASTPTAYQIVMDGKALSVAPTADGRFRVSGLPPGPHTIGLISSGGMAGHHTDATIVAGQVTDLGDVTPTVGGQIVGLVMRKDASGALSPLAGVKVIADSEPPVYIMGGVAPAIYPPPPRDGDAVQLSAITDDGGSYTIPAVPEGAYVVTVNVPGLMQGVAWVWVSAGTTVVADFQLEPAIDPGVGTVQGTVLGDGPTAARAGLVPLVGAMVSIFSEGDWGPVSPSEPLPLPSTALRTLASLEAATGFMAPPYRFGEFSTLTDEQGKYSLNVPSGYLTISVWGEGYGGAGERFALQPGETVTKDYTLEVAPTEPPVPVPVTGK